MMIWKGAIWYLSIFIKINMSRFTMFLYVEGQLIGSFVLNVHNNQNTDSWSYIMHDVRRITEGAQNIYLQCVENILGKMLTGLIKLKSVELNTEAYLSRVQP